MSHPSHGTTQPRPFWLQWSFVVPAAVIWVLGILWIAFGGLNSLNSTAHQPWVRQCMALPEAPSNASFFIPPIHSADGRYCLSAPSTETTALESGRSFAERRDLTRIDVWDAQTQRYFRLQGHTGRVRCFALSAPLLLTASDEGSDSAVRLWSLETGELLRTFDGAHPPCWGGFGFMGFSADHRLVLTATEDHAVRIWDTASGQALGRVVPPEGPTLFAFSPDSSRLALAGFSGDISVWDWRAGRSLRRWHAHDPFGGGAPDSGGVERMEFSPDGGRIRSSGPIDGSPAQREWDVATGRQAAP